MLAKKQKLSKNQHVVLEALKASDLPLSAYQILDAEYVRSQGLKAPLTIYRALDKLIELGLVHRIESLNAFVACNQGHHHTEPSVFMICEKCNRITEISIEAIQATVSRQAAEQGFKVNTVHVEASGLCRACMH